MQLSNIVNWRQLHEGDCLAACVAMVLTHLGQKVDYAQLLRKLGVERYGAPFSHLERLNSRSIKVELQTGTLESLDFHLSTSHPVIVPVATEFLPYWLLRPDLPIDDRMTEHAVVVVGIDEENVWVNDPDFAVAPQIVDSGWFEEAWRHHDRWYAVIRG